MRFNEMPAGAASGMHLVDRASAAASERGPSDAIGRFWLSFFRTDPSVVYGLQQAQLGSLFMVAIAAVATPILFRGAPNVRTADP
ncbi:MAG: hypothetical protein ACHQ0J_09640 [Candidatus Dormibacterales bacterium]